MLQSELSFLTLFCLSGVLAGDTYNLGKLANTNKYVMFVPRNNTEDKQTKQPEKKGNSVNLTKGNPPWNQTTHFPDMTLGTFCLYNTHCLRGEFCKDNICSSVLVQPKEMKNKRIEEDNPDPTGFRCSKKDTDYQPEECYVGEICSSRKKENYGYCKLNKNCKHQKCPLCFYCGADGYCHKKKCDLFKSCLFKAKESFNNSRLNKLQGEKKTKKSNCDLMSTLLRGPQQHNQGWWFCNEDKNNDLQVLGDTKEWRCFLKNNQVQVCICTGTRDICEKVTGQSEDSSESQNGTDYQETDSDESTSAQSNEQLTEISSQIIKTGENYSTETFDFFGGVMVKTKRIQHWVQLTELGEEVEWIENVEANVTETEEVEVSTSITIIESTSFSYVQSTVGERQTLEVVDTIESYETDETSEESVESTEEVPSVESTEPPIIQSSESQPSEPDVTGVGHPSEEEPAEPDVTGVGHPSEEEPAEPDVTGVGHPSVEESQEPLETERPLIITTTRTVITPTRPPVVITTTFPLTILTTEEPFWVSGGGRPRPTNNGMDGGRPRPGTNEETGGGRPGWDNGGRPTGSGRPDWGAPDGTGGPGSGRPSGTGRPGGGRPNGSGAPGSGRPSGTGIPGGGRPSGTGVPGGGRPTGTGVPGGGRPNGSGVPGDGRPDGFGWPGGNSPEGATGNINNGNPSPSVSNPWVLFGNPNGGGGTGNQNPWNVEGNNNANPWNVGGNTNANPWNVGGNNNANPWNVAGNNNANPWNVAGNNNANPWNVAGNNNANPWNVAGNNNNANPWNVAGNGNNPGGSNQNGVATNPWQVSGNDYSQMENNSWPEKKINFSIGTSNEKAHVKKIESQEKIWANKKFCKFRKKMQNVDGWTFCPYSIISKLGSKHSICFLNKSHWDHTNTTSFPLTIMETKAHEDNIVCLCNCYKIS